MQTTGQACDDHSLLELDGTGVKRRRTTLTLTLTLTQEGPSSRVDQMVLFYSGRRREKSQLH